MAPSFLSVPSAQLCLMQQGREAGSGQRDWLRAERLAQSRRGGNPPCCPSQLPLQETEASNQMASKAVILQIVLFNLVSRFFIDQIGPKCWFSVSSARRSLYSSIAQSWIRWDSTYILQRKDFHMINPFCSCSETFFHSPQGSEAHWGREKRNCMALLLAPREWGSLRYEYTLSLFSSEWEKLHNGNSIV